MFAFVDRCQIKPTLRWRPNRTAVETPVPGPKVDGGQHGRTLPPQIPSKRQQLTLGIPHERTVCFWPLRRDPVFWRLNPMKAIA